LSARERPNIRPKSGDRISTIDSFSMRISVSAERIGRSRTLSGFSQRARRYCRPAAARFPSDKIRHPIRARRAQAEKAPRIGWKRHRDTAHQLGQNAGGLIWTVRSDGQMADHRFPTVFVSSASKAHQIETAGSRRALTAQIILEWSMCYPDPTCRSTGEECHGGPRCSHLWVKSQAERYEGK